MDISKACMGIAQHLGQKYILKERDLTFQEVFSVNGLLPAIAKRADRLASLSLGYGLGIKITNQEKTMLNKTVVFDDRTPRVIQLLCLLDVIVELKNTARKNGKVPLDQLLVD